MVNSCIYVYVYCYIFSTYLCLVVIPITLLHKKRRDEVWGGPKESLFSWIQFILRIQWTLLSNYNNHINYNEYHVRMTINEIRWRRHSILKPSSNTTHLHLFPLAFFALKYCHLFHSLQAFAKMTFYTPSIFVFMRETSRIFASISKNFYVSPSPHSVHMTERYSSTSRWKYFDFQKPTILG